MESKIHRSREMQRVGLTFQHQENVFGGYDLMLKYRGKEVGSCTLAKTRSGIADYLLDNFRVEEEFRKGHKKNINPEEFFGFGSDLLEYVNDFILSTGKSAYLINATEKDFNQFYQRHGWTQFLSGSNGILLFNKKKL